MDCTGMDTRPSRAGDGQDNCLILYSAMLVRGTDKRSNEIRSGPLPSHRRQLLIVSYLLLVIATWNLNRGRNPRVRPPKPSNRTNGMKPNSTLFGTKYFAIPNRVKKLAKINAADKRVGTTAM